MLIKRFIFMIQINNMFKCACVYLTDSVPCHILHAGRDFYGSDIKMLDVTSEQECASACDKAAGCDGKE